MMFGVCHILGMSSTCTTPILYAFLNNSFRYQRRPTLSPITRNTPAPQYEESIVQLHQQSPTITGTKLVNIRAQSLPKTSHMEMREV